ncbi:hypothetical protein A7K94_0204680 [Modestobacter sp. VKM Ac-2676]|nr:hypothetical protein A7K94_0204680 [Modestobacter sp. VKM Ac-2676]
MASALVGAGDGAYALLAGFAALPYLVASAVAAGFTRGHLGPDHDTATDRAAARDVLHGMVAGARHVLAHPPATAVLAVMAVHRLLYGLLTLVVLLLYRNTFTEGSALFPGGLAGLGQVLAAGAVGTLLAAVVTPVAVRRMGKARWITLMLTVGGAGQLLLGGLFLPATTVAAVLTLGFIAQAVKICVDTTLQESIDDDFRGRVFSVYDTLFNVTFVVSLLVGAFLLPASGMSWAALAGVGVGYLLTAAAFARWCVVRRRCFSGGPHPEDPAAGVRRRPELGRERHPATSGNATS